MQGFRLKLLLVGTGLIIVKKKFGSMRDRHGGPHGKVKNRM